jgi:hypothetical protein
MTTKLATKSSYYLRLRAAYPTASEDGFALMSVLIAVFVLAILAIGLLATQRTIALDERIIIDGSRLRRIAESGIDRATAIYASDSDPLRKLLRPDGRTVDWHFEDVAVQLKVQAESGKPDLNAGNTQQIRAIATKIIPETSTLDVFLNNFDNFRNAQIKIDAPASLLPPLARMSSLRDIIEDNFTVLTGQTGIDPMTAPEDVLDATPMLPPELHAAIQSARANGQRNIPYVETFRGLFVGERPIYTFRARAKSGTSSITVKALMEFREKRPPLTYSRVRATW